MSGGQKVLDKGHQKHFLQFINVGVVGTPLTIADTVSDLIFIFDVRFFRVFLESQLAFSPHHHWFGQYIFEQLKSQRVNDDSKNPGIVSKKSLLDGDYADIHQGFIFDNCSPNIWFHLSIKHCERRCFLKISI